MSRRPALITEAEIARAVRGVERAAPGRFVLEIDLTTGVVRATPVEAGQAGGYAPAEPGAAPGCGLAGTL
jgi:hypothetical protein